MDYEVEWISHFSANPPYHSTPPPPLSQTFLEVILRLLRTNPSLESAMFILQHLMQHKFLLGKLRSPKLGFLLISSLYALARQNHFQLNEEASHAKPFALLKVVFNIVKDPEFWAESLKTQPREILKLLIAIVVRVSLSRVGFEIVSCFFWQFGCLLSQKFLCVP